MFRTPLRRTMIGQKFSVAYSSPSAGTIADTGEFDPKSITGLLYWFAADKITGVTVDDTIVTTWTDSSGNNRDAVAGGTQRPTFKTNIKNGKPAIRFNGTTNVFRITGSAGTVNYTSGSSIFVVLNPSGSSATGGSWFSCHDTSYDYEGGNSWLFHPSSTTQLILYWRGSRPGGVTDANINTIGQYTATVQQSAGNITQIIRRNKTQLQTHTQAALGTCAPTEATIGGRFQTAFGSPFVKADILEILIYNTFIGTTNRDAVENYLATKYAL